MTGDFQTTAQDRWYEKSGGHPDKPSVTVWMPTSPPSGYLRTLAHGCQEPDTLPDGPAIAYVTIGGVQFGGYLGELEMLFDAARENIGNLRNQYEHMRAAVPSPPSTVQQDGSPESTESAAES